MYALPYMDREYIRNDGAIEIELLELTYWGPEGVPVVLELESGSGFTNRHVLVHWDNDTIPHCRMRPSRYMHGESRPLDDLCENEIPGSSETPRPTFYLQTLGVRNESQPVPYKDLIIPGAMYYVQDGYHHLDTFPSLNVEDFESLRASAPPEQRTDWYETVLVSAEYNSELLLRVREFVPDDPDDDRVPGHEDNCPDVHNPFQWDLDRDGIGDVCDSDEDGDGLVDAEDLCPWCIGFWGTSDCSQDHDNDCVPDLQDPDDDEDGILDGDEYYVHDDGEDDNLTEYDKRWHLDADNDGEPDDVDDDDDGDGMPDSLDPCPMCRERSEWDLVDLDHDGLGNACDFDDDGDTAWDDGAQREWFANQLSIMGDMPFCQYPEHYGERYRFDMPRYDPSDKPCKPPISPFLFPRDCDDNCKDVKNPDQRNCDWMSETVIRGNACDPLVSEPCVDLLSVEEKGHHCVVLGKLMQCYPEKAEVGYRTWGTEVDGQGMRKKQCVCRTEECDPRNQCSLNGSNYNEGGELVWFPVLWSSCNRGYDRESEITTCGDLPVILDAGEPYSPLSWSWSAAGGMEDAQKIDSSYLVKLRSRIVDITDGAVLGGPTHSRGNLFRPGYISEVPGNWIFHELIGAEEAGVYVLEALAELADIGELPFFRAGSFGLVRYDSEQRRFFDLDAYDAADFARAGQVLEARDSAFGQYIDSTGVPVLLSFGGDLPGGGTSDGLLVKRGEEPWALVDTGGAGPSARAGASMVVDAARGRALLLGGRTANAISDELWSLDLDTLAWTMIESTGYHVAHAATTSDGDRWYLFGGLGGGAFGDETDVLLSVDLTTGESELLSAGAGPAPRHSAGLGLDPATGRLFVAGGIAGLGFGLRVSYEASELPDEAWPQWSYDGWGETSLSGDGVMFMADDPDAANGYGAIQFAPYLNEAEYSEADVRMRVDYCVPGAGESCASFGLGSGRAIVFKLYEEDGERFLAPRLEADAGGPAYPRYPADWTHFHTYLLRIDRIDDRVELVVDGEPAFDMDLDEFPEIWAGADIPELPEHLGVAVIGTGGGLSSGRTVWDHFRYSYSSPAKYMNDVWVAEPGAGGVSWSVLVPPCEGPGCEHPGVARPAIAVSPGGDRISLLGGVSEAGADLPMLRELDPTTGVLAEQEYLAEIPAEQGDCDGTGEIDPGFGLLCVSPESWWGPVGEALCGSDGELSCSAGPVEAERLSRLKIPFRALDLLAQGGKAYVGTVAGLVRYDLSDPARPLPDLAVPMGPVHDVEVRGEYAYAGGLVGLVVVDLTSGLPVGYRWVGFRIRGLALSPDGQHLYAAGQRRFAVVDVSDPGRPRVVASERRWFRGASAVEPLGSDRVVVTDNSGLTVIDVSDPDSPEIAAQTETPRPVRDLVVRERYAYMLDRSGRPLAASLRNLPDLAVTEGHLLEPIVAGRQDLGDLRIRLTPNQRRLEIVRAGR